MPAGRQYLGAPISGRKSATRDLSRRIHPGQREVYGAPKARGVVQAVAPASPSAAKVQPLPWPFVLQLAATPVRRPLSVVGSPTRAGGGDYDTYGGGFPSPRHASSPMHATPRVALSSCESPAPSIASPGRFAAKLHSMGLPALASSPFQRLQAKLLARQHRAAATIMGEDRYVGSAARQTPYRAPCGEDAITFSASSCETYMGNMNGMPAAAEVVVAEATVLTDRTASARRERRRGAPVLSAADLDRIRRAWKHWRVSLVMVCRCST